MPLPEEPVQVPPEALALLASLRAEFEGQLPKGTRFGVGAKQTGGEFTPELALIVYVPQKLPVNRLRPGQLIPEVWRSGDVELKTDVVESNPVPIAGIVNDNNFYKPLLGGIEIQTIEIGDDGLATLHTGTLGCIVQRRSDGARGGLTCEHVAPMGLDVWQPRQGLGSGAFQASIVGKSVKAIPASGIPGLDCAMIELNGSRGEPVARIQDIGPVEGSTAELSLFQPVKKRGRTTGLTTGQIVGLVPGSNPFEVSWIVCGTDPPGGLFCWHGDSGSVVLNVRHEVLGLLGFMDPAFTGPDGTPSVSIGWAKAITPILDASALDIEIAVSPPKVERVQPETALGVLSQGGFTQIDGWGFDAGSQVSFGGVLALNVIPASPRRLIVTPPVQFIPGQTVDVIVMNSLGEESLPAPGARFTY
ncbi:hypothetical protein ACFY12_08520 [Streptomyces sp. NPDC001339]|uniref:hypothetical protein n=1 Tax=Streptomyces sp. NPDC001339 TaxID=3364563 RepID=UPI0036B5E62C